MREHPLATTLRIVLIGIVCAFLLPTEYLIILATGFGWWPGCGCCAGSGVICGACVTGAHSSVQVVVTGSADSACTSCNQDDGTFTIDLITSSATECRYCTSGSSLTSCSHDHRWFRYDNTQLAQYSSSHQVCGAIDPAWIFSLSSASTDCNSWNLTLTSSVTTSCDYSAATAVVTPV